VSKPNPEFVAALDAMRRNAPKYEPLDACPKCGGQVTLCRARHTYTPGPEWHCHKHPHTHNFPAQPATEGATQ